MTDKTELGVVHTNPKSGNFGDFTEVGAILEDVPGACIAVEAILDGGMPRGVVEIGGQPTLALGPMAASDGSEEALINNAGFIDPATAPASSAFHEVLDNGLAGPSIIDLCGFA